MNKLFYVVVCAFIPSNALYSMENNREILSYRQAVEIMPCLEKITYYKETTNVSIAYKQLIEARLPIEFEIHDTLAKNNKVLDKETELKLQALRAVYQLRTAHIEQLPHKNYLSTFPLDQFIFNPDGTIIITQRRAVKPKPLNNSHQQNKSKK